jgi:hypothetical protein
MDAAKFLDHFIKVSIVIFPFLNVEKDSLSFPALLIRPAVLHFEMYSHGINILSTSFGYNSTNQDDAGD